MWRSQVPPIPSGMSESGRCSLSPPSLKLFPGSSLCTYDGGAPSDTLRCTALGVGLTFMVHSDCVASVVSTSISGCRFPDQARQPRHRRPHSQQAIWHYPRSPSWSRQRPGEPAINFCQERLVPRRLQRQSGVTSFNKYLLSPPPVTSAIDLARVFVRRSECRAQFSRCGYRRRVIVPF